MNVDYDDPSLDSLLTEHARRSRAAFTTPALDGMLGAALDAGRPRRRWVWPVLAAVLLLAIPLITVLLVRHGRTNSQPAHPNTKLVEVGPVSVTDPVWTGHSIQFTAQFSRACQGARSIQAKVTADSATSVTIVATEYLNPDPAAVSKFERQICTDPPPNMKSYGGGGVELPEPLKGRTVIDGTTRTTLRVLDASIVPSIPGLPPTFHSRGYYGSSELVPVARNGQAELIQVGRSWADNRVQISLTLSPAALTWPTGGEPSTIGLVNGHETEFLYPDGHMIAWKNGAQRYGLSEEPLNGTRDSEFSPQQLLNLARSVR
jgi:hypothetical protein